MQQFTVLAQWERFEIACIPSKTNPWLRREMQRAFYAGIWSQMQAQKALFMDLDPHGWGERMGAIEAECQAFLKPVEVSNER